MWGGSCVESGVWSLCIVASVEMRRAGRGAAEVALRGRGALRALGRGCLVRHY